MLKIVLTGSEGQLGKALAEVFVSECVLKIDTHNCDITNRSEIMSKITSFFPDVVLHCAAYTSVDQAEKDFDHCYEVNARATKHIVDACFEVDAELLYVSTDYVFSGDGEIPYEVEDKASPLSTYGMSKMQGEEIVKERIKNHYVIRTSWLYGDGNNFVKTIINLAKTKNELNIVSDQIGSPTYTVDLAKTIFDIIKSKKYGTYHVTNEGFCSWADFAELIFLKMGITVEINRVTSEEYKSKAQRPKNSRLSKSSLDLNGIERLPNLRDALERYLPTIDSGEVDEG